MRIAFVNGTSDLIDAIKGITLTMRHEICNKTKRMYVNGGGEKFEIGCVKILLYSCGGV